MTAERWIVLSAIPLMGLCWFGGYNRGRAFEYDRLAHMGALEEEAHPANATLISPGGTLTLPNGDAVYCTKASQQRSDGK